MTGVVGCMLIFGGIGKMEQGTESTKAQPIFCSCWLRERTFTNQ